MFGCVLACLRNRAARSEGPDSKMTTANEHGRRSGIKPFVIVSLAYILISSSYGLFGAVKDVVAAGIGISMTSLVNLEMVAGFISALAVIPAGLLISRFGPGRLAWISILIFCIGLFIMATSSGMTLFATARIIIGIGSAVAIPLLGQVARDTFETRLFVVATTLVFVSGRAITSVALVVAGLVHETFGWRNLYIIIALLLLPLVVLAWSCIKPIHLDISHTTRRTMSMAGKLLKNPLVWLCGIASGLTYSTSSSFGFVWNINLQTALGWDSVPANMLVFIFVLGLIIGGWGAGWLSKRHDSMRIIFTGLTIGTIMFALILFVTPFRGQLWYAIPCLLTLGASFGTATIIMPYVSSAFAAETSAVFFAVVTSVRGIVRSLLIGAPLWHLSSEKTWEATHVLHSLIPYLVAFIIGIGLFGVIAVMMKRMQPV